MAGENLQPVTPSPQDRLLPLFIALVVVVMVVAGLAFVYLATRPGPGPAPTPSQVTIRSYAFQWSSPPSTLCSGETTSWPAVPFSVAGGAQFSFGWQFNCWNNTGAYVIDNITGVTTGFALVWSNLPVQIVSTNWAYFNVTLSAPNASYDGGVTVYVTAHAA